MIVKTFAGGILDSNTYVVANETSKKAVIIDCGNDLKNIVSYVEKNRLSIEKIILTHGHFDHAYYLPKYNEIYKDAGILCNEKEIPLLYDSNANLTRMMGHPTVFDFSYTTVKEGDIIKIEGNKPENDIEFEIMTCPGHTPGCMCLYCKKEKIIFTGDVIFDGSRGRTDFAMGDDSEMLKSLKRLAKMDDDITFYPGHYNSSTLGMQTWLNVYRS